MKLTHISRGMMQEGDVRSSLNISVEIARKGRTNCWGYGRRDGSMKIVFVGIYR